MASNLDCNTPQGRQHIAEQHALIALVCDRWGCDAIVTPDDRDSPVDVIFSREKVIAAVAEVKSRPTLSLDRLRAFEPPTDGYLITYRKLVEGIAVARELRVPYYVFVGLADGIVVYWRISDERGQLVVSHTRHTTQTKATCNGGSAWRENAYLKLEGMQFVGPAWMESAEAEPNLPLSDEVTADDIRW